MSEPEIAVPAFLSTHGLADIIRIPEEEYGGFPEDGYLAHFNLASTDVEKGKHYVLPRILRHGQRDIGRGTEAKPPLSFKDICTGVALEVRNHIPYTAPTPPHLQ